MKINKLTYKDFKIGQTVLLSGCGEKQEEEMLYNIYLTLGNYYVITDLDFHFPNKICINKDNGGGIFIDIKYFDNVQKQRDINIDKLLNL